MSVFGVLFFTIALGAGLYAQDFGFGFDDDEGEAVSSPPPAVSVKVGGEITAALQPYVHDFSKDNGAGAFSFWDMASGSLKFNAAGKNVEAIAAFNLNADAISELWDASPDLGNPSYTPLIMDEAFLRGWIGPVTIEAGFRKLTWGKADSLGPLDVTNPMDYTDLRDMTDIQSVKIARPMAHVAWNVSGFSKIEAVFIPNFAGHRFAQDADDRWTPSRIRDMPSVAERGILNRVIERFPDPLTIAMIEIMYPQMAAGFSGFAAEYPDTSGLDYLQAGLRFTTTIGPADLGFQYFYGNLFQPDFTANVDGFIDAMLVAIANNPADPDIAGALDSLNPQIKYNRYHQIGIDYAQVVFDFNIRAELALFLTNDLKGSDGAVRNPFIGWSLGFDRDLVWGINANIQCNETLRLLDNKVGKNPVEDCEAGTKVTSTRITMRLSKKFFKDELESRATIIWDIENSDCYVIPALIWTVGDLSTELSAGIFAGDSSGNLGQYWENSFVKLGLTYSF